MAERTCAIYARYSSLAQRDQSIEDQVAVCRKWAACNGFDVVAVYADRHVSGTTDKRPEFQRMVNDAKDGEFSTILVYKSDRFMRDKTQAAVYRRDLRRHGVEVLSATEAHTDGPEGVLVEGLLDALNEYFVHNLSQNVMRGMESNARKCLHNGVRVLGYDVAPDGRYQVNEAEAAVVRELFERRAAKQPLKDLAAYLASEGVRTITGKAPTVEYVRKRLRDERYIGTYTWGGVRVEGGMPAILDLGLWTEVQRMNRTRRTDADYCLTGVLFDEEGRGFFGASATSRNGARHRYYTVKRPDGDWRVRADDVEAVLCDLATEALSAPGLADAVAKAVIEGDAEQTARRAEDERRAKELEREERNCIDAIAKGIDPSLFTSKLEEIALERKALAARAATERWDPEDVAAFVRERLGALALETSKLDRLVDRVVLDKDAGTVEAWFAWGPSWSPNASSSAKAQLEDVRECDVWCTGTVLDRTLRVFVDAGSCLLGVLTAWRPRDRRARENILRKKRG